MTNYAVVRQAVGLIVRVVFDSQSCLELLVSNVCHRNSTLGYSLIRNEYGVKYTLSSIIYQACMLSLYPKPGCFRTVLVVEEKSKEIPCVRGATRAL